MKPSIISATLSYDGRTFPVMVESVNVDHGAFAMHDSGIDGRRWISVDARHNLSRVTITGIIDPPPVIELPFTRRDRFTLAELLPKSEPEYHDDDPCDWD